jgi:DNA-binding YbaB/EbfC family protein
MAESKKPSLTELMQTAQKMQQGMREAQEKLAKLEIEGNAGGGMVIIKMNGRHEVLQVKISEKSMKEYCATADGREVLEDLIKAAANDAKTKVEKASQEMMISLTKGLGLPPDFEIPTGE